MQAAAESELKAPLAHVLGEPVHVLPTDLFIPPDALRVLLETFEGPLDLLLYLIRKQNLDVLDIPMAELTAQYMLYVQAMETNRIELAAEYLLMAATLIEIKSRLLVPPRQEEYQDDFQEDPRAELVRRLLEYEQMKAAAQAIDVMPQAGRDFLWVALPFEAQLPELMPEVTLADLKQAWMGLLQRSKNLQHHTISAEKLSVREQMSAILKKIANGRYYDFAELFDADGGASLLVTTFIAVLELVKERLITVAQFEPMAPLYVQIAKAKEAADA